MRTATRDPRPGPGTDTPGPSSSGRALTALGVAVALAIVLFWIWIFSGAPGRENPDYLEDRSWVERAQRTCDATRRRIDDRTDLRSGDRGARADAIAAGNRNIEAMLEELRDPLPSTDGDRLVVRAWLSDWEHLLEDRVIYANAVRDDPDARFVTREKFNDPLDRVVQTFAEVNEMPECAPMGDVG